VPVPSCAPRQREQGAGRDVTCAPTPAAHEKGRFELMNRFLAPLSFTVAAAWVVLLFVLVHNTP
jgi:hypothetical protein